MNIKVNLVSEIIGGIADYTDYLIKSLENYNIKSKLIWLSSPELKTIFITNDRYQLIGNMILLNKSSQRKYALLEFLTQNSAEIIHIQHEKSLFPSHKAFLSLIKSFRICTDQKLIITLHSVYIDEAFIKMIKSCSKFVDMIVVHQENAKNFLISKGILSNKLKVIPHGTPDIKSKFKSSLYKTNYFKILFTGYIKNSKNFSSAILSLSNKEDIEILIAGKIIDSNIIQELNHLKLKSKAKMTIIPRFLSTNELLASISQSDLLVLPYKQEYYSSSGILHLGLGLHKPMLVSASPKFEELTQVVPFCKVNDNNYYNKIQNFQSKSFTDEIVRKIEKLAEQTSWNNAGKKTAEIYQMVLNN